MFADDNDCRVVDPLCDFELATCSDICNLVIKGTSKLSTDIDIISATLLKSNIAMLAPVLTHIVNLSIESSMPAVMKHAVVTPLLKKSDLDPEILSNYIQPEFHIKTPREVCSITYPAVHGLERSLRCFSECVSSCS